MPRRTSLTNLSNLDEQQTFPPGAVPSQLGPLGGSDNASDSSRSVGILGVIVIGFFWVAGGIYGGEQLISTGTPGFILIGVIAGGVFFALPFALMCAELATTYPENGGVIVPVRYALGMTSANYMAYLNWIVNALDASIYPLLAAEYVAPFLSDSVRDSVPHADKFVVSFPIVCLVTLFNLGGLNWVVRFSNVIFTLALTPCLIYIFWCVFTGKVAFDKFGDFSGDLDYSLAVSWIIWLYSGFVSLGILAGEVKNPQRTFTVTVLVLVPLTISLNVLPIITSLAVDSDPNDYEVGYFEHLAEKVAGAWLKYGFIIGSMAAYIGLYNSQIVSAQEAFAFIIEANLQQFVHVPLVREKLLPLFMEPDAMAAGLASSGVAKVSLIGRNSRMSRGSMNSLVTPGTPTKRGSVVGSSNPAEFLGVLHENSDLGQNGSLVGSSVIRGAGGSAIRGSSNGLDPVQAALMAAEGQDMKDVEAPVRTMAARRFYVLVNFVLICVFEWLSYEIIVQAEMLVNNVPLFLLCYSFLYLKIYEKDRKRPFAVPGGMCGAWAVVIVPTIILVAYTVILLKDPLEAIETILLFIGIVGFGVVVHILCKFFNRRRKAKRDEQEERMMKNDESERKRSWNSDNFGRIPAGYGNEEDENYNYRSQGNVPIDPQDSQDAFVQQYNT